ncbi:MAG: hypothetical protein ABIJ21_08285 [Nanoarchaeota archaeon]
MEKRLTAQGPYGRQSFTVTLPIEWVKDNRLEKSRIVELAVVGKKVIISANEPDEKLLVIDGDVYSSVMIKVLQHVFRLGRNEVKIRYSDEAVLKDVEEIIEGLIGYEILEVKDDYVIIRDITRESEEFKAVLRRIFLLLLELSESGPGVKLNSLDKNVKKLINYCQRIIMLRGHTDYQKTPAYYLLLDRLEKLGDEFRWYITTKAKHKQYLEMKKLLRVAYNLFYKFDSKEYARSQAKTYLLLQEIRLEKKTDRSIVHLHNLARILNSLYGDVFMIAGV